MIACERFNASSWERIASISTEEAFSFPWAGVAVFAETPFPERVARPFRPFFARV
jgi:hypothetical protein